MNMPKDYYYYERINGKPLVTVCFLVNGNEYARGISACSFQENPIKEQGRLRALSNAVESMEHKQSFLSEKPSTKMNTNPMGGQFLKGEYMPQLRKMEKKFVDDYNRRFKNKE